jgi:tRNA A-37 threonylcarbamoyl transferase component Bud32
MVPEPLKKARELPQIPGYRIEGIVGRGATGIVYRARQASVDRVVALKVLHQELVGSASALRRMQREARLTAKLAHPNIISAIDMGELGGQLWYAMELVDGLSLAERIAERPLSEREALRIFIPLCEALRHAHERGVVHRDVKPANILIERGGRALLVDLGLAYSEDDPVLTKSGGTLGTPHYISPEQARDPASADVQSDLWSFGATLYHAVTGRTPFQGESVAEILSNVLYARVPDPREQASELSSGLVLVLRKCLTRDRAARYHTPAELLADLERLRERRAPQITGRGLDPLERRPLRGPRLWAALAGGVLVLGTLGWLGWHAIDSATSGKGNRVATDPFAALDLACEGPAAGIGAALSEQERLAGTEDLAPRARERLESIRNRLLQRLDAELGSLKHDLESQIDGLLVAREFDQALALAKTNPRGALARRIGTLSLPEKQSQEIDGWREPLVQHVNDRYEQVHKAFQRALDLYGDQLRLQVDAREREGDWKGARALVMRSASQLLVDSKAETHGLDPADVEQDIAGLRDRADSRRVTLDDSWASTDKELVTWIEERAQVLARELEERRNSQAEQTLQTEFAAQLAKRGLSPERMPVGLVHRAPEAAVQKGRELEKLEAQLADQDSQQLFDELELQAEPLWRARRYEDVEQLFAGQTEGLLRGEAAARAGLRVREARLLAEMLRKAAQKLASSTGQRMELSTGTVPEVGVLEVPPDPLASGFKLRPDGAVARALVLRAPKSGEKALATESLAKLAGLAPEAIREPGERLLRALFLFHEAELGDVAAIAAVSALLDRGGGLPDGEPLVKDLGLRVDAAHGRTLDAADRQRSERAHTDLNTLRYTVERNGNARVALAWAEKLLKEDLWREDEKQELRSIRDAQRQRLQSGPLDELRSTFSPDEIEEVAPGRARLYFDLARQHGNALAPGTWILNVTGWSPPQAARSDEELLARAGPTLALEPLRTEKEEFEVALRIEQPADQPPRFLLVSAAGFHVGFLGAPEGGKSRWLAGTRTAAGVLEDLRRGNGREFAGWKPGTKPTITLKLHRARGRVELEIDGSRIDSMNLPAPRLEGPPVLSVRSWECLRLLALTIVAARP